MNISSSSPITTPSPNFPIVSCCRIVSIKPLPAHCVAARRWPYYSWIWTVSRIINDSLGHDIGDNLLVEVAARLKATVRDVDTVARLGGDEFVVVLREIRDTDDVDPIARKIQNVLREPFRLDLHQLTVTPSIGVSLYPEDGGNLDTLMKNADSAMYAAKQAGRDACVFFAPSMNAGALERLAMENSLRNALQRDEFELHFQPRVNLNTSRIVGFEALIRWRHPELGDVSPTQFIPLAEETGLIVPIGAWVLTAACRQNRIWQDLGLPPVPIAVNLSSRQFRQSNIKQTVLEALASSELDGAFLELELTESVVMENPETSAEILNELKQTGLKLSIDDFGTGYSSLTYLKRFPLDTLKIDQSFVRDLVVDPDDAAIVSAVISMAHDLDLEVVAEGVETQEQMRFLRGRQCDEAQGYLFGRPVDAETAAQIASTTGHPGGLTAGRLQHRRKPESRDVPVSICNCFCTTSTEPGAPATWVVPVNFPSSPTTA